MADAQAMTDAAAVIENRLGPIDVWVNNAGADLLTGAGTKLTYAEKLQEYQKSTGLKDAVITGVGKIDGHRVALGVMDFSFLGGSMGSVVGEKLTRLIEAGTEKGLPVIIISSSGMAAGGRVLHHLARLLPEPRNTVVFVGFQAVGTRGQAIQSIGESPPGMAALIRYYDRPEAAPVRRQLLRMFRSEGGEPGRRKLAAVAENDPDPELRREAARLCMPTHPRRRHRQMGVWNDLGDSEIQSVRREQLIRFHRPVGESLLVEIISQGFDHMAILLQAVDPRIVAEDFLLLFPGLAVPGKWHDARVFHAPHGDALRLVERLIEIDRHPGMARDDLLLDAHHVHDREYAGAAKMVRLGLARVGEEAANLGHTLDEGRVSSGSTTGPFRRREQRSRSQATALSRCEERSDEAISCLNLDYDF